MSRISTCILNYKTRHFINVFRNISSSAVPVYTSLSRKDKYSHLLTSYGFNPGQINRIFNNQVIVKIPEKDLLSNLVNWLNFGVGDKLFTALSAYPELLTLDPEEVNHRVKELMTLFTKADINKLLITCPNVFLGDFQNTYDKVQYIVSRMGFEQKSIVKSEALKFDFHHIKCRHNFMMYAGCYKLNKKAAKNKNAPLHKIFSNNIDTFLKLTKLTEEEYDVFLKCFSEEIDCFRIENFDEDFSDED